MWLELCYFASPEALLVNHDLVTDARNFKALRVQIAHQSDGSLIFSKSGPWTFNCKHMHVSL